MTFARVSGLLALALDCTVSFGGVVGRYILVLLYHTVLVVLYGESELSVTVVAVLVSDIAAVLL